MPPISSYSAEVNSIEDGLQLLEALTNKLNLIGFESRQIGRIEVAFTEALVNAVKHGNREDPKKSVRIRYDIDPSSLWLAFEDEGEGFLPSGVADPTESDNLHRPGGRGILLMRTLMNHVEYNSIGNRVVMRMNRFAA